MPIITRKTITETFLERTRTTPTQVGFEFKPTHPEMGTVGQWKQLTFREYFEQCSRISNGLMGLGIRAGDRVVIISNSRIEWSLSDMAILGAKAVTVPIYASNTPEDVAYILDHSDARIAIAEDEKQVQKILDRKWGSGGLPKLEKVIVLEPSAMKLAARYPQPAKNMMTLQALEELGRRTEAREPRKFEENLASVKPTDVFTICYTSGTTGVPKGVVLNHDSLMSVIEDCVVALSKHMSANGEVIVSFLPFSHIFGRVESMATHAFAWKQVFAENMDKLAQNLSEARPTALFSVPRVFEKVYGRVNAAVEAGSPLKRKMFAWALQVGRKYYEPIWAGKSPSLADRIAFNAANKLVFGKVAQRLGGRLRFAVSGGAPLPKEIGQFFQIVGIQILEGYGLTETCAPVTVNTPEHLKFGAVGRPLSEVTIKIAEDGEVLVKSRKLFTGYFKMEEETRQVLKGGWFHTGDIGFLDEDGFLHITDRKKDIIVTSAGKNIAPQKIENLAKTQKMVSQFVVHGDRRNYLTALIVLDRDQVTQYANEHHILFSEYGELVKHPKVIALAQKVVDDVNSQLASYETVKKFVILPNEFTVENGDLTPSLKVRRRKISDKYKDLLDAMYSNSNE